MQKSLDTCAHCEPRRPVDQRGRGAGESHGRVISSECPPSRRFNRSSSFSRTVVPGKSPCRHDRTGRDPWGRYSVQRAGRAKWHHHYGAGTAIGAVRRAPALALAGHRARCSPPCSETGGIPADLCRSSEMRTTIIKSSLAALSAYWVQIGVQTRRIANGAATEVAMNFPFGDDIIS